ncbi:MAG: hypothetical protein J0L93_02645 [Deltaproteobacteria bacterium]|nr:hypothetical protein [Deltaproteobacteria bacterium]
MSTKSIFAISGLIVIGFFLGLQGCSSNSNSKQVGFVKASESNALKVVTYTNTTESKQIDLDLKAPVKVKSYQVGLNSCVLKIADETQPSNYVMLVPEIAPAANAESFKVKSANAKVSLEIFATKETGCRHFEITGADGKTQALQVYDANPLTATAAGVMKILSDSAVKGKTLSAEKALAKYNEASHSKDTSAISIENVKSNGASRKFLSLGNEKIQIEDGISKETVDQLKLAASAEKAGLFAPDQTSVPTSASPALLKSIQSQEKGMFSFLSTKDSSKTTPAFPEPANQKAALGWTKVENWVGLSSLQLKILSLLWWSMSPMGHPRNFPSTSTPAGESDPTQVIQIPSRPVDLLSPYVAALPAAKAWSTQGRLIMLNTACWYDEHLSGTYCDATQQTSTPQNGNVLDRIMDYYHAGLKYGLATGPVFVHGENERFYKGNTHTTNGTPDMVPLPYTVKFASAETSKNPSKVFANSSSQFQSLMSFPTVAEAYTQANNIKQAMLEIMYDGTPGTNATWDADKLFLKIRNYVMSNRGFKIKKCSEVASGNVTKCTAWQTIYDQSTAENSLVCPSFDPESQSALNRYNIETTSGYDWSYGFDNYASMMAFVATRWVGRCYESWPDAYPSWMTNPEEFIRVKAAPGGGAKLLLNTSDYQSWSYEKDIPTSATPVCGLPTNRGREIQSVTMSPWGWFLTLQVNRTFPTDLDPAQSMGSTLFDSPSKRGLYDFKSANSLTTYFQQLRKLTGQLYMQMNPVEPAIFKRVSGYTIPSDPKTLTDTQLTTLLQKIDTTTEISSPFSRLGGFQKVSVPTSAKNQFNSVAANSSKSIEWDSSQNLKVVTRTIQESTCTFNQMNNVVGSNAVSSATFLGNTFIPSVYQPGASSIGCGFSSYGRDFNCPNCPHIQQTTSNGCNIPMGEMAPGIEQYNCSTGNWSLDTATTYNIHQVFTPTSACQSPPSDLTVKSRKRVTTCDCYKFEERASGTAPDPKNYYGQCTYTEVQTPNSYGTVDVKPEVQNICRWGRCGSDIRGWGGFFSTGTVKVKSFGAFSCTNPCVDSLSGSTVENVDEFWSAYLGLLPTTMSNRKDYLFPTFKEIFNVRNEQISRWNPYAAGTDGYKNLMAVRNFLKLWATYSTNYDSPTWPYNVVPQDSSASSNFQDPLIAPRLANGGFYNSNIYVQMGAYTDPFRPAASSGFDYTVEGASTCNGVNQYYNHARGYVESGDQVPTIQDLYSYSDQTNESCLARGPRTLTVDGDSVTNDDLDRFNDTQVRRWFSTPQNYDNQIQNKFGYSDGIPLKHAFGADLNLFAFEPSVDDRVKVSLFTPSWNFFDVNARWFGFMFDYDAFNVDAFKSEYGIRDNIHKSRFGVWVDGTWQQTHSLNLPTIHRVKVEPDQKSYLKDTIVPTKMNHTLTTTNLMANRNLYDKSYVGENFAWDSSTTYYRYTPANYCTCPNSLCGTTNNPQPPTSPPNPSITVVVAPNVHTSHCVCPPGMSAVYSPDGGGGCSCQQPPEDKPTPQPDNGGGFPTDLGCFSDAMCATGSSCWSDGKCRSCEYAVGPYGIGCTCQDGSYTSPTGNGCEGHCISEQKSGPNKDDEMDWPLCP